MCVRSVPWLDRLCVPSCRTNSCVVWLCQECVVARYGVCQQVVPPADTAGAADG